MVLNVTNTSIIIDVTRSRKDDGRTAHKAGNEPRRKAPLKAQANIENGIENARKATAGTDVSRICTEVHTRKRTQDDGGRVKRADGVP